MSKYTKEDIIKIANEPCGDITGNFINTDGIQYDLDGINGRISTF